MSHDYNNDDYGYFGKGFDGYVHYMQAFDEMHGHRDSFDDSLDDPFDDSFDDSFDIPLDDSLDDSFDIPSGRAHSTPAAATAEKPAAATCPAEPSTPGPQPAKLAIRLSDCKALYLLIGAAVLVYAFSFVLPFFF